MPVETQQLWLARMNLDLARLAWFQKARGLPTRADDLGYVVHCALGETFGERAPKPFSVLDEAGAGVTVLGYVDRDAAELRDAAERPATSEARGIVSLSTLAAKPMPTEWPGGRRLRFQVTCCPVMRKGRAGSDTRGPEIDVFLDRCAQAPDKSVAVSREAVYVEWLASHLERQGGARVVSAGLEGYRLARLIRRRRGNDRSARVFERPSASLAGVLEVGDNERFRELVSRGIGRHRAFGFGMLLLRRRA